MDRNTFCLAAGNQVVYVALRKESVDRNISLIYQQAKVCVALRKESVDRNGIRVLPRSVMWVALRKESVDRNKELINKSSKLSSRSPQGERG